jgi:CDP-paratose 2-epimerase
MGVALVTGSGGLIGSEMCEFLCGIGVDVVGIDNDMRKYFFGAEASTSWRIQELGKKFKNYSHHNIDIRDTDGINALVKSIGASLKYVVHCAAQPSHDWAAREPITDFETNAKGTLNILEAIRQNAPDASFVHMSTNKVYGDRPNSLPLVENETRYEIADGHEWQIGIPEDMSIDQSTHSVFGASKVAADVMVQEYGRYFGIKTGCFRGGCLTGGGHSGAELHGFLAYLMKCTITNRPYKIFGYKAKQVRDNIHASDLVAALWAFLQSPKPGEVYNIGGSRFANCSMLEAIALCEEISGKKLDWTYLDENRTGDHIWWISDISKFQKHFPDYSLKYDLKSTLQDIHARGEERWAQANG